MARNKEGLVLLLDVGPSMHRALQEVENVCLTLVCKKLVYNRSDEVGVVLFGTKGIASSATAGLLENTEKESVRRLIRLNPPVDP